MWMSTKSLYFHVATLFASFQSHPVALSEAHVVNKSNESRLTTAPDNASQLRRYFLSTVAAGGPIFLPWTTISSTGAAGIPKINNGGNPNDLCRPPNNGGNPNDLCRPPEKLSQKLSDTRAQIDMAVQASSVQAFSSAAEMANDVLLDSSSLKQLIAESCENGDSSSSDILILGNNSDVVSEILQSVEKMRSTLNKPNTLTTEDVKDVMRYGTTTRSAIDSLFAS